MNEGFAFLFTHNETSNTCKPLSDCANDIVSFFSLVMSDSFLVDDIEYTLDWIGFSVNGVTISEFSTVERQTYTA